VAGSEWALGKTIFAARMDIEPIFVTLKKSPCKTAI
jgi:hypothetical protein